MTSTKELSVLFVCTGNLCRSPMAEGMFRERLRQQSIFNVLVESAGIHTQTGLPPERFAIEVAADYGANIAGQRSRPLEPSDYGRFKHLIAMDLGHLDYLLNTRPQANAADMRLLLDDVGGMKKVEVPDPYKQDREAFEFSGRLINVGLEHLMKRLGIA